MGGVVCRIALQGFCYQSQDVQALRRHIQCVEDTEFLRDALPKLGLVAFVGNGAILPRSDIPFRPFQADLFQCDCPVLAVPDHDLAISLTSTSSI